MGKSDKSSNTPDLLDWSTLSLIVVNLQLSQNNSLIKKREKGSSFTDLLTVLSVINCEIFGQINIVSFSTCKMGIISTHDGGKNQIKIKVKKTHN